MQKLRKEYFNPFFSHIYVEKKVRNHPRTRKILEQFPSATVVEIDHYKDVFCRSRQAIALQRQSQSLLLAAKEGKLIYPGAAVCQSFGNTGFYYTSCIMNCIYDCSYCYLKGMYASANIVIFVNIEDIFVQAARMAQKYPLYLCVSYDTDLLAMEHIAGYAGEWEQFVRESHAENDLQIEIRTKCANRRFFADRTPQKGVIYAFTLSPQAVIDAFEHHTPSFAERLACAAAAVNRGFSVRLCFDPMIYVREWRQHYSEMLDEVFLMIPAEKLVDVSVGSFRIPQDYLKNMRKREPDAAAVWFPYQNEGGVCHYPDELMNRMESYLVDRLKEHMPSEKIFLWK